MKRDARAFLFDFHHVLSHDHFYESTLLPDHKEVSEWISQTIFGDHELVRDWMRGKTTWRILHDRIVGETGMDRLLLDQLFIESVKRMKIIDEMIDLARELKEKGFKIAIVSDNMDIFSEVTVPYQKFDQLFDEIFNSADHGLLKQDEHGKLFQYVADILGVPIENTIFIDDTKSTTDLFIELGGQAITHTDPESTRKQLFLLL
ncbi:MAG: HAD hydrolase-like protein [Candidatus Uhrbacteria bacterium]|nr:HAD hydrolase-like protein [Candidatus Uhrbacteria bacterium]